jgi:hypothetical protein
MARRRVFRTRVTCPGIKGDLGPISDQRALVGRVVTFEKGTGSEVKLLLDSVLVGCLDVAIGTKVGPAIDRGQAFTAVIENAFPIYNDKFKPTGASVDIKVEYLLEKGQPAIETENCWRCVESPEGVSAQERSKSFFTTVAGVTFEGRQRIVARCSVGERLILVRDPNHPVDKGAIKVMRLNGQQLGFVPAHVSRGGDSSGLASRMDRGEKYQCRIGSLTGGGEKSLGVNIEITEDEDFEPSPQTSAPSKIEPVAPIHSNLGWWLAAAVVLLLVVFIIMHQG